MSHNVTSDPQLVVYTSDGAISFPSTGVKILFRVGLVLLKCMLGTQEKLKYCQGLYETMELLRAVRPEYMKEAFLVQEVATHVCHILSFFFIAPS